MKPLLLGVAIFVSGMLTGGVCTFVLQLARGDSWVRYRIADDDPTATYMLNFPLDEVASRLDASGLFHGAQTDRYPSLDGGILNVDIDNNCRAAVVQVSPLFDGTAIRLKELAAREECAGGSGEEGLRALFEEEVLARLAGTQEKAAGLSEVDGENFEYAQDDAPSILLAGSREDFARRLDNNFFAHEFHDGVYQLGPIACFGRFRADEQPDGAHVVVTGIGFALPCYNGATEECLARLFEEFLRSPDDPSPTPELTPEPVPPFGLSCLFESG